MGFKQFLQSRVTAAVDKVAGPAAELAARKDPAGMVKAMANIAGMMKYPQAYKLFLDGITGDMNKAKKKGMKTPDELKHYAIGQYPGFYELLETYKIDREFIDELAKGIAEKD